jgi:hypothetical protein
VEIKTSVQLNNEKTEIFACRINPDDSYLACGCGDGIARIFSYSTGKLH